MATMADVKASATYPEDVVRINSASGAESYAVVLRCWADEQNPEAVAEAEKLGIPFKPLVPGELEVLHPSGIRAIIQESTTTVVDRGFMAGDVVRVSLDAPPPLSTPAASSSKRKPQAGIITSLSTKVQLQKVISQENLEGWHDAKDLVAATRLHRGDHVVFQQWVGLIEEVFEVAMVETTAGEHNLRRVCDVGKHTARGASAEALMLDPYMYPRIEDLKRVRDVRQIVAAVNWLCMSQRPVAEADRDADWEPMDAHRRPKRYWMDLDKLSLVRAGADHLHSVGDKVVFRFPPTSSPAPSTPLDRGNLVHVITRTESTATVLFQDGTTVTAPATSFVHCVDLDDDLDVFPGDVGVWTNSSSGKKKIGVVQRMDARARTVTLRWLDESGLATPESPEVVSGLEFDPHGPPPEVYGVRRQDYVLVCGGDDPSHPTTNGAEVPTVPRLGENEALTGEFPSVEKLRAELSVIGIAHSTLVGEGSTPLPKTSATDLERINWYGEVQSLELDGRVIVRYPSGRQEAVPLAQLYHLDDGMEFGPDGAPLDGYGSEGSVEGDGLSDGAGSGGSWETDSEMEDAELDGNGWAEEENDGESEEDDHVVEIKVDEPAVKAPDPVPLPRTPTEVEDHESWKRFEVLEEAPPDHHYAREPISAPSKAFMARVKKEYNVLSSSLPPNILVRAYESRADLLRCLIIGPLGTPFQNAPFLFDMHLPPTRFPQEPPSIFFHSWAGGTRVSPNLYAEGKVCLSLLGTWSGEKSESWSAARSSILQIFISIQSLIMVEKPYYTEPGFEKQSMTIEGEAASDLYNERTFTLTRAFVKRALEHPPTNFATEINAYYLTGLPTTGPGALQGVVDQARRMLEESEAYHRAEKEREDKGGPDDVDMPGESEEDRGRRRSGVLPEMRILSEGAGLSLKRTLEGLKTLLP